MSSLENGEKNAIEIIFLPQLLLARFDDRRMRGIASEKFLRQTLALIETINASFYTMLQIVEFILQQLRQKSRQSVRSLEDHYIGELILNLFTSRCS